MNIQKITMYPQSELIRRLREVTLTDGVTKPYKDSLISVEDVSFSKINFAQRYVLKSELDKVDDFNEDLKNKFSINPPHSDNIIEVFLDNGMFTHIPPIIEWTPEDDYYVSDGMHRLYRESLRSYCAKVIVVKMPSSLYYSYPCKLDWGTLPIVDERPEVRKAYRDPNNYKALFRDYNSQFPGIQRDRSKDNAKR